MQNKGSELPKEHILVCLSSSPSNERIVRMAGKMAQAFSGSLTALYVQTPGYADMNAEDTVRLQANMRLAQQFGAEIITTHGEDAATQIAEYARLSDVTKIVIGRSGVQRRHFCQEVGVFEISQHPEVHHDAQYDEPPFRGAAPHAVDALRDQEVARGGEDEQQEIDAA